MKKSLLVVSLLLYFQNCFCQTWLIDFESPDTLISIDSSAGNIWQIGSPHKSLIDSSFNGTNAIVTDTINYYPPNNKSIFLLKLPSPFVLNGNVGIQLDLNYKLDSDTLRDGGSIEVSFDNGSNWINLFYASSYSGANSSSLDDILFDGTHGISGNRASMWNSFERTTCLVSNQDSVIFRFTFRSDSIDNGREGWLIDNIMATVIICEGIQEINTNYHFSSVFPDPVSNTSFLQIKNQNSLISQVDFYDVLGRKISSLIHPDQSDIAISKEKFDEGIFFYRVELSNHKVDSGTFVVQ